MSPRNSHSRYVLLRAYLCDHFSQYHFPSSRENERYPDSKVLARFPGLSGSFSSTSSACFIPPIIIS